MNSWTNFSRLAGGLGTCLWLAACSGGGGGGMVSDVVTADNRGLGNNETADETTGNLSSKSFKAALGDSRNSDHRSILPPIGNQGSQGSCVGWATGYYVKTAMESRDQSWNNGTTTGQFSPAWIYNQINNGVDQGSLPSDAMKLLVDKGAATQATMPYDEGDFTSQPSQQAQDEAVNFKNDGFDEYAAEQGNFGELASGMADYIQTEGPLVLGISVYENFYDATSEYTTKSGSNLGGHAIAAVGYDEGRNGGSFLLANSWGESWGERGFTWVSTDVLGEIFLGAWTMKDGANGGGGGGDDTGGEVTVPSVDIQVYGTSVDLAWAPMSAAHGWVIGIRSAESSDEQNPFEGFQLEPSEHAYTFFGLEPNHDYEFLVAAVKADGELGDPYTEIVTTEDDGEVNPDDPDTGDTSGIGLMASNPENGASFSDRIQLDWNAFNPELVYVVLRAFEDGQDNLSGYQGDKFEVIGAGLAMDSFNDFDVVGDGASYIYWVLATNPATDNIIASSDLVRGATSGFAGGIDLSVDHGSYEGLVVELGDFLDAEMLISNNSNATSPNQLLWAGIEYYFWADDAYGILWYDDFTGEPIYADFTEESLAGGMQQGHLIDPFIPGYLVPNLSEAWHSLVYWVDPLNDDYELEEDIDWSNNVFYDINPLNFVSN